MTTESREYLIDHFRVTFHGISNWDCDCREFLLTRNCRHIREAAGMREAQAQILRRHAPLAGQVDRRRRASSHFVR